MLTAITTVTTDRAEYTRYERIAPPYAPPADDPGLVRIAATLMGDPDTPVAVALVRADTGRIVASAIAVTADGTTLAHTFDLERDPPAADADGHNRAIHGTYVARLTDASSVPPPPAALTADSPPFRIAAVSAATLRAQWLRGIDARDTTRVTGAVHGITGVTLHDTYDIERGGYPLAYDPAFGTLAWREGPPVGLPAPPAPPVEVSLWNATLDARITATVDPAALPTAGTVVQGYTMYDYPPLTDADIARHIDDAYAAFCTALRATSPEPVTVCTPALRDDYPTAERHDHSPRPYRRPTSTLRHPSVELGLRRVLSVHQLDGRIGDTTVIAIPAQWRNVSALNGVVSFVPALGAGQSYPAPTPLTAPLWGVVGYGYAYGGDRIPAFWHVAATIGLPDLHDGLGATIRQYIARRAVCGVLMVAGRARQGAQSQESFGRDGVSLSVPFTGGQAGVYSDAITGHQAWCDATLPVLRRRLTGDVGVS